MRIIAIPDETDLSEMCQLIRSRLGELETDMVRGKEATATVMLDQQAIGRLSRQDALISQAMSQAQQERRALEIRRLRQALARIEEDEYGYCEDCGERIPIGRLRLDPAATRCVSCASG